MIRKYLLRVATDLMKGMARFKGIAQNRLKFRAAAL
jgi:hypothetical protein